MDVRTAIVGAKDAVAASEEREDKERVLEDRHILVIAESGVLEQERAGYPVSGVVEAMAARQHDIGRSLNLRLLERRRVREVAREAHGAEMDQRDVDGSSGERFPEES